MSIAIGRAAATGRVGSSGRVASASRVTSAPRRAWLLNYVNAGLEGYWVADAGATTLVAGKASVWEDQSGKGRHLLQGTASRRPTYTSASLNNQDGLTFAGSQFLSVAANTMTAATNWTMGGVFKCTNLSGIRNTITPCQTGGAVLYINAAGAGKREIDAVSVGTVQDATATTNAELWIASRSTTTLKMYLGTSGTPTTLDFPAITVLAPGGALTLAGARTTVPQFGFVGIIYELFVMSIELDPSVFGGYLSYALQRYGAL